MKPTIGQIEEYLIKVDKMFPVPLSCKQDLKDFAKKLYDKATLCLRMQEDKIVAMVAGYTENLANEMAYISIVATCKEAQGNGYAPKLIHEFISICKEKKINAVHLYVVPENEAAVQMYKRIGFQVWEIEQEPRPEDLHLIYYINEEK